MVHRSVSGRGHYVTYLSRNTDHRWTLFDDHKVQEVSEGLVLRQEATILIYSRLRELRQDPKETDSPSGRLGTPLGHEEVITLNDDLDEATTETGNGSHTEGPSQSQTENSSPNKEPPTSKQDVRTLSLQSREPPERIIRAEMDEKQVRELQAFQTYCDSLGLEEEEIDPFGNCLFLSLVRQVLFSQKGR